MSQPTAGAACEAASVLSNLPEYEVLEVTRDELAGRMLVISTPIGDAACPDCGVLTRRVHQARATRSFAWLGLPVRRPASGGFTVRQPRTAGSG